MKLDLFVCLLALFPVLRNTHIICEIPIFCYYFYIKWCVYGLLLWLSW